MRELALLCERQVAAGIDVLVQAHCGCSPLVVSFSG